MRPRILKPWGDAAWERRVFEPDAEVVARPCEGEAELAEAVADIDVLLADVGTPVTSRVIAAAPRLRAIMCYATGVDHVDLGAATGRGIYVSNTPGYATLAVAEHALALLFALARKLLPSHRLAAQVSWREYPPLRGWEIEGKTLGVIGLGPIGRIVAAKGAALGMRVLAHSRHGGHGPAKVVDLDDLLEQSDAVSLHCALTRDRVHLIGPRELRLMRPSAILLNTARGALVNEEALVRALREGWIAGAGLDVLEGEPPAADHPLLAMDNVIVTPHNAYNTHEAEDRFRTLIRAQVQKVLAGEVPEILVNPAAAPGGEGRAGAGHGGRTPPFRRAPAGEPG